MSASWQQLQLGPGGRSLIEASAGTGKTWTIAVLYLRLLLEQGLSPRQIVVTTFTDASALELRERLRLRLLMAEARALSATPPAVSDAAAEWLDLRWQQPAQRQADLRALQLALAALDHAPISTLHGLCRRILQDQPFACGVDFERGELVDGAALREEICQDLWRRLQQGEDQDPLRLRMQEAGLELKFEELREWIKRGLQPGLVCDTPELEAFLANPALAAEFETLAGQAELFAKKAVLPRALLALADSLRGGAPPSNEYIARLLEASAQTGVLSSARDQPRLLGALQQAETLAALLQRRAAQLPLLLLQALIEEARGRIQARLMQRRLQSFDSLLESVDQALAREATSGSANRPLADALFATWPVALVDEFQDTDGLQYAILDRIYRGADAEPRGRLAMIGDPKQAIYRFRGSDIHAYARAAEQADEYLPLAVNQRSSHALVAAFNELFERAGPALAVESEGAIHYQAVRSAGRADARPLCLDGQPLARPLHLHFLAEPPSALPERRELALQACAAQIVELLNDPRQQLDGKRLSPADIAVLLPTARDIADLRLRLEARGVACVSASRDSVFQQDCARELQVLLYGVLHSSDAGALRAAAATRLWGVRLSEMRAWEQQPEALQQVAAQFRGLAEAWQGEGVHALIDRLLERLAPRALATREGERLLTDLRHLGELLQAEAEQLGGPQELLLWLDAQRGGEDSGEESAADERQLRIESQLPRLRLMTLHKSKGLEFPIVFLPLMWAHAGRFERAPYRITDARGLRPRLSFEEGAKLQQQRELQDERFRLLYVALTRAEHACHLFALPPGRAKDARSARPACEGADAAALDVLLQRMGVDPGFDPGSLQYIDWRPGWHTPEFARWQGAGPAAGERAARPSRPRAAAVLESKHSFTGLIRGGRDFDSAALDAEAAASDEDSGPEALGALLPIEAGGHIAPPEPADPQLLALQALRGAGFGTALHGLLETRELGRPLLAQLDHVRRGLAAAGLRRRDFEALLETDQAPIRGIPAQAGFELAVRRVAARLDAALAAPLGLAQAPQLSLAEVAAMDQRAEMGFEFALPEQRLSALAQACARHGEPNLVPASERRVAGLMTGKIDLVLRVRGRFHVLDYKGNWLGERLADYCGDTLVRHMDASHYRFQALLYTLALDRYLAQRMGADYVRAEHLGEGVYLFLRAAGLAPGAGIWRQRFSEALIDAAQATLAGTREAQA